MGGLNNQRLYLVGLEARKSKVKVLVDSAPSEVSLQGVDGCLLSLSSDNRD